MDGFDFLRYGVLLLVAGLFLSLFLSLAAAFWWAAVSRRLTKEERAAKAGIWLLWALMVGLLLSIFPSDGMLTYLGKQTKCICVPTEIVKNVHDEK